MESQPNTNHDVETPASNESIAFASRFIRPILTEIGLTSVFACPTDIYLLYLQRFVRLFAYGGSTLILASYLSALGHTAQLIGLFMTLTLAGDVVISFLLTLFADRLGRKATLALGSVMMSGAGVVFALCQNYWVLLAAAILGVISPNGNEIGPFRALEESIIAHLTDKRQRADVFAWYALLGTAGTACGMIFCGYFLAFLQDQKSFDYVGACRAVFWLYAGLGAMKLALTMLLSKRVERDEAPNVQTVPESGSERQPLLSEPTGDQPAEDDSQRAQREPEAPKANPSAMSMFSGTPHLQRLMLQLCLLFALDSFASGLAPLSWMTFFFKQKFSLPSGQLGSIFFVTSIISAASTLCAASIARRIGNVKTMVFTHLPSAVCLSLIPIPSSLALSLVFLIGRACTQSMDVAPRSAFLAAALPADQRTAMMGLINVVKTCSTSIGPFVTGILADHGLFWVSFTAAGCLKAAYDIGMLLTFAGTES